MAAANESAKSASEAEETNDSRSSSTSSPLIDPAHPKLSIWRKITYGVGSMLYSMTNVVIGFFLQIFLLEVAILDPIYVSVIVLVGRVWDAITDPAVGYFSSRSKTRIGRLRPWLLISVLPGVISYFCLWIVPYWSDGGKFAYYFIIYLLFQALLSCYHVPYTALVMHLTNCNKQRDSATLYRMVFEVAGTMLGSLIQGLAITAFVGSANTCENGGVRTYDIRQERAYRYGSFTIAVITFICGLITFFGVKEQKDQQKVNKSLPFLKGIKYVLTYKPYITLALMYMLSWLAIQIVQGNLAVYINYVTGLQSYFQYIIITMLVSIILSMPLWQLVIIKFGKKMAFYIGTWDLMIVCLIMLFLDDSKYTLYIIFPLAVFAGIGGGCIYLLPWSMLPDVIDQATLDHGVRREELFYSFYVFFSKFGAGISLGVSTLLLGLVGYDETMCSQIWIVPLTLRVLLSAAPILLILCSLLILPCYPITKKARHLNRQLLANKKNATATAPSYGTHNVPPPYDSIYQESDVDTAGNSSETGAARPFRSSRSSSRTGTPDTPQKSFDSRIFHSHQDSESGGVTTEL